MEESSPIQAVCVSAYVFREFSHPQKWPEIRFFRTSLLTQFAREKVAFWDPKKESFSSSNHLGLFIFQLFILGPQLFGILAPQVGLFRLPVLGLFRLKSGLTWPRAAPRPLKLAQALTSHT